MPATLRTNELPEFPIRGPFGGIQSEMPLEAIEAFGFADARNIMFRRGEAAVRPAFNNFAPRYPIPTSRIVGIADFFDSSDTRHQVVFGSQEMYVWDGSSWTQIIGAYTDPGNTLTMSWTVVGQRLCFSQGINKVQVWDGLSLGFGDSSPNAVAARHLVEFNNYLLAAYTDDAGVANPQRYHWTGPGDPTDWISLNAGQDDLFNALGPITGLIKLGQNAFIPQQKGWIQLALTGDGLAPFRSIPLSSQSKGNVCPYSLAVDGEDIAFYVGKDNIYQFDGSASYPIGDRFVDGGYRQGARTRIFGDLVLAPNLSQVYGFISSSLNGNPYKAYWLIIPNVAIWVFNMDEGNWTRITTRKTISAIGNFAKQGVVRIEDLVGTIAQQSWSPATLTNNQPFDSVMLGCTDTTLLNFDFTGTSEEDWYLQTGQLAFGDYRHDKTVKKLRVIYRDTQPNAEFTTTFVNELGDSDSIDNVEVGNGQGNSRSEVIPHNLPGKFLSLKISGAAGQQMNFTEITPIYDISGEQRG